jgi:hypothetical protein
MTTNALPTGRQRLVPLAALATVIALAASASAAAVSSNEDEPQAATHTTTTSKATVKSLAKQVKKLTKRIAALEQKKFPDSAPPSGPARGDLFGSYPNPVIAANAVGPNEIPNETLTGLEITPDSLFANDLAPDSVGGSELKGAHAVVGAPVAFAANQVHAATVTCPAGEALLSGGFAWQGGFNARIIDSAPSDVTPNKWVLRASSSEADTLYAWALCLLV